MASLWEYTTSTAELPSGVGLSYVVRIQSGEVPHKKLRNLWHRLIPNHSPERAGRRREKIIKKHNLENLDVVMYYTCQFSWL